MKRRHTWALFNLLLFLAGTLIVPAMHRLELVFGIEVEAENACCAHAVQDHPTGSHGEKENDGHPHREPHRHNPATCSICQLAQAPADACVVAVMIPRTEIVVPVIISSPRQPVLKAACALPFSRGPPA